MSLERVHAWLGWLIVVGIACWMGSLVSRIWETPQPVGFSHKKHVEFGMACDACHEGAKDSVKAGVPNTPTCALCHQPGNAGPKTPQDLAAYIRDMKEIPWKKIYKAPPHVRFSHKRHVEMAGLDCKVCHGDIQKMDRAVGRQIVPLHMERCMDCHRREKVATDCLACHR